jgi:hypothetical protein
MCKILGIILTVMKKKFKTFTEVWIMNTPLGFFWSEFHDGIAMPLKSIMCFFYFLLFFALFTVAVTDRQKNKGNS